MVATSAFAANIIWDGGAGSGAWGTRNNWNTNRVPAATDSVQFNAASAGGQYNISLGGARTTAGVTFSSATGTNYFTIGSSTYTLSVNAGGITNNDAQTQVFNSGIYVNSAQAWTAAAGGFTFNGNVGLQSNLTVAGTGTTTVAGVITDGATAAGSLTKTGTGTLVLSGANTYTGVTNISAGTLRLGANSVLSDSTAVTVASGATLNLNNYSDTISSLAGAGVVTLGSGTLTVGANDASSTFSGSFTSGDTGTFAKTGTGTLTFGAGMDLSGGTLVLNGGRLNLGGFNSTFGTLSVTADSILDFGTGGGSVLNVLSSLTVNSGVTLTIQNWTDAVDYFYSLTNPGATNLGRIVFSGFTGSDTKWLPYDNQVTPVPEPSVYGALLMGAMLGLVGYRRWHARRSPDLTRPA